MGRVVSVIGAGRIGQAVISHVARGAGLTLGRVLSRSGRPDTADPDSFLATPADIVVETAGPDALRAFGARVLERSDLWTVGAAALVDDDFRAGLEAVAARTGRRLRLFAPWMGAALQAAADPGSRLHVRALSPGLDRSWSGPLREAAYLFPHLVNSPVAAALCGPGIDRTTIEIGPSADGRRHVLSARLETCFGLFTSEAVLDPGRPDSLHPTAAAIIAALEAEQRKLEYG